MISASGDNRVRRIETARLFDSSVMGDVVAFVNLRISEGHLRQLIPTRGQRGLGAARRTTIPDTGPLCERPG
jgi:hypothetical protein